MQSILANKGSRLYLAVFIYDTNPITRDVLG